jgi:hypothetical protein
MKLPEKDALVFFADERVAYLAPELDARGARFANLYSQPWYDGDRLGNPIDRVATFPSDTDKVHFLQYSTRDPRTLSPLLKSRFPEESYAFVFETLKTNMIWSPNLCRLIHISEIQAIKLDKAYHHDSPKLAFSTGWSQPEDQYRWTDGHHASMWFSMPVPPTHRKTVLTLEGMTLGKQRLELKIDGQPACAATLDGSFIIRTGTGNRPTKGGAVKLEFFLPDATPPGNGDPRQLGLALHALKVVTVPAEPGPSQTEKP